MVKAAGLVTRPLISRSRREKLGRPMSGLPSWLLLPANPPDIQFSFGTNQVFRKGIGLSSAAGALTCVRPNPTLFAYAPDSSGNWLPFAPNVPRITDLGLLIEEGRANSIRNNGMAGAFVMANGVELATNSSLAGASGTSAGGNLTVPGWTTNVSGGTIDAATAGQVKITGNGTDHSNYIAQQIFGLTVGRSYVLSVFGTTGGFNFYVGTSANDTTYVNGPAGAVNGPSNSINPDRVAFTAPAGPVWVTIAKIQATTTTVTSVSVQDGERCQNGGFTANPINAGQSVVQNGWQWNINTGTGTVTLVGNTVQLLGDTVHAAALCTMALPTVSGFTYTITADITGSAAVVNASTALFGGGTVLLTATSSTGTQQKFQFTATTSTTFIQFTKTAAATATIANVSVQSAGALPTNWNDAGGTETAMIRNVVAVGITKGIDTIDIQWVGTTNATARRLNFDNSTAVTATYGQTWTHSFFAALVGGSLANIVGVYNLIEENQSGGTNIGEVALEFSGSLSANLFRSTQSRTVAPSNAGALQPRFGINVTNGQAVNATFRIGWPQLENNNINSSVASAALSGTNGSGGTDGAAVYQVGGGTVAGGNVAATLNVTITGGVLSAVNSVAAAGGYTVLPPSPAPISYVSGVGSGLTGATVNLTPTNFAPQAFATSPIKTTGSVVSRTGETITAISPPSIGSAASLFVQATPMAPIPSPQNQYMMECDDGEDVNERIVIFRNTAGSTNFRYSHSGSNVFGSGAVFPSSQNTQLRAAEAGTSGDYVSYLNGSQIGVSGTAGFPSGLTTLRFGTNPGGFQTLDGFISQAALWANQRLSNANLQAITQLPTPAADLDLDFTANTLMLSGVAGGSAISRLACVRAAPPAYVSDGSGNWASVAANTARMSDLGLLVEESRTNAITNSAAPTSGNGYATESGGAATLQSGQGPGSGLDAYLFDDGSVAAATHRLLTPNSAYSSGTAYTYSAMVKYVNNQWLQLGFASATFGGTAYANFDVQNGVLGTVGAGTTGYIKKYLNGWCLIAITATCSSSASGNQFVCCAQGSATARSPTYDAAHNQFLVWNQQSEVGASVTSPIVTGGSSVTRAADVVTLTSPPVFGSSYTMFAKGTGQSPTNTATTAYLFNLSDGTATNMATIFRTGGSQVASGNLTGGTGGTVNSGNFVQNVSAKAAFAVTAAYQGFSLNGAVATGAIATLPTGIAQVTFGNRNIDGARAWNGFVERAQLWPTTLLSPANLISITT